MHTLKRYLRGFCSLTFKLTIFLTAISAAVITTFGTPSHLKHLLKTSGLYEHAVDSVIDQAKKDQTEQQDPNNPDSKDGGDIPIDDPAIQAAVKNALPADFLEKTTNQAIDGIFGWLEGKTETPVFVIDLTEAKQKLATGIADAAYAKASALPPCTAQQLQTINPNDVDIFTLPCLPPNVNLAAERDKLQSNISSGKEFLDDTTVSSADLPKEDGKTVFDKANYVPTAYQWLVRVPWILGGVSLLTAAGLVFLHEDRRRGLFVVGRSLLIAGVSLLLAFFAIKLVAGMVDLKGDSLQVTLTELIHTVGNQLGAVLMKFGLGYSILGAGTVIGLQSTKPKPQNQKTK